MAKGLFSNPTKTAPAPASTAMEPARTQLPATPDVLKELGFDPADNLKDEQPDIPILRILPQAQMFELPDGSKTDRVEGIILVTHRCNGYWNDAAPEDGNRPACSSLDDLKPLADSPKPQSSACATCWANQFGSEIDPTGAKGRGKACKNMRRIYLLVEGHEFPFLLSLSPTSLKPAKRYLTMLADRKRHPATVITRIGLDKQTAGSNVYSVANFEAVRDLDDLATLTTISKLMKQTLAIAKARDITSAEVEAERPEDPFGDEIPEPGARG